MVWITKQPKEKKLLTNTPELFNHIRCFSPNWGCPDQGEPQAELGTSSKEASSISGNQSCTWDRTSRKAAITPFIEQTTRCAWGSEVGELAVVRSAENGLTSSLCHQLSPVESWKHISLSLDTMDHNP